ncbi:MAG: hypothetical protein WAV09_03125 [Minisyncoccia bacterium]
MSTHLYEPGFGQFCGQRSYDDVFFWADRHTAWLSCDVCKLMAAVADANGLTPENYMTKLNFDNPREIIPFQTAIRWVMEHANDTKT